MSAGVQNARAVTKTGQKRKAVRRTNQTAVNVLGYLLEVVTGVLNGQEIAMAMMEDAEYLEATFREVCQRHEAAAASASTPKGVVAAAGAVSAGKRKWRVFRVGADLEGRRNKKGFMLYTMKSSKDAAVRETVIEHEGRNYVARLAEEDGGEEVRAGGIRALVDVLEKDLGWTASGQRVEMHMPKWGVEVPAEEFGTESEAEPDKESAEEMEEEEEDDVEIKEEQEDEE